MHRHSHKGRRKKQSQSWAAPRLRRQREKIKVQLFSNPWVLGGHRGQWLCLPRADRGRGRKGPRHLFSLEKGGNCPPTLGFCPCFLLLATWPPTQHSPPLPSKALVMDGQTDGQMDRLNCATGRPKEDTHHWYLLLSKASQEGCRSREAAAGCTFPAGGTTRSSRGGPEVGPMLLNHPGQQPWTGPRDGQDCRAMGGASDAWGVPRHPRSILVSETHPGMRKISN